MSIQCYKWKYDYSKTLWMKMFLARPDFSAGRSEVLITFEQALDIIRVTDALTCGIRKIVYLVGWQGLGHDDCHPEADIANEALKRSSDATAWDSIWWLFEEAKKYNTVISFHCNLSDEVDGKTHDELVKDGTLVNDINGKPAVLQILNGRDCYKISYKQFVESGHFKRIWDRFCELSPVREAGTVHLDNFCIAESLNPRTYIEEQDEARNTMLDYIQSTGVDVTSEYTYREAHFRNESPTHPNREMYAQSGEDMTEVPWQNMPVRTLGKIPATWWTSQMSVQECIDIPPEVYSGHLTDQALLDVFYGAMHGEDIWMKYGNDPGKWVPEFIYGFCTLQLPYFYLNRYRRLSYSEENGSYSVKFSAGVESNGRDRTIKKDGIILKEGDDVALPLDEDNNVFIIYSGNGRDGEWNLPDAAFTAADIEEITADGHSPCGTAEVADGKIKLNVGAGQMFALRGRKV